MQTQQASGPSWAAAKQLRTPEGIFHLDLVARVPREARRGNFATCGHINKLGSILNRQ